MGAKNIIVMDDLSLGRRVRIARFAKGWRQIDLAAYANVQMSDVSFVERDWRVRRDKLIRILKALELYDPAMPIPDDAPW